MFDSQPDEAVNASDGAPPDAAPCTGPFGPAQRLTATSSPGNGFGGVLSSDGLELFFSSTRAGGAGGADLYVSTRDVVMAPFGPPTWIAELAGPTDDDNPFVEADGLSARHSPCLVRHRSRKAACDSVG